MPLEDIRASLASAADRERRLVGLRRWDETLSAEGILAQTVELMDRFTVSATGVERDEEIHVAGRTLMTARRRAEETRPPRAAGLGGRKIPAARYAAALGNGRDVEFVGTAHRVVLRGDGRGPARHSRYSTNPAFGEPGAIQSAPRASELSAAAAAYSPALRQ